MADVTMTELEVKTEDLSKTPEKDNRVMVSVFALFIIGVVMLMLL